VEHSYHREGVEPGYLNVFKVRLFALYVPGGEFQVVIILTAKSGDHVD